jgi:hypothetical protein
MAVYDITRGPGNCAACGKRIDVGKKAYKIKRKGIGGFLKSTLLDGRMFCSLSCLKSKID